MVQPLTALLSASPAFSSTSAAGEVRIYTISGKLVRKLDIPAGGETSWNLTNDTGNRINSGLYVYIMSDVEGGRKTGKLVITN